MVGDVEEAKCPKKRRFTHFKTMPQAAGKNVSFAVCTLSISEQTAAFS